jgi:hypothetical protein
MENIEYTGKLKSQLYENNIVHEIVYKLNEDFKDVSTIKNNVELIGLICNIIEDVTRGKNMNKEDLFMKIYKKLFPDIVEADKVFVNNIIQFLLDKKLVKGSGFLKRMYIRVKSFFSKKN